MGFQIQVLIGIIYYIITKCLIIKKNYQYNNDHIHHNAFIYKIGKRVEEKWSYIPSLTPNEDNLIETNVLKKNIMIIIHE